MNYALITLTAALFGVIPFAYVFGKIEQRIGFVKTYILIVLLSLAAFYVIGRISGHA